MPYQHGAYTLYTTDVKLKNGRMQTLYFFSKKQPKSGKPCDIPSGKEVGVNKRTSLPYLRNKK